ncbi:MAG: adenosylcobinamide-GDP ribazoletransferase [Desulfovibrio sp.]|jgi:adenosylcobinamide-GDP ribazoletransferase|nr:adenosylcobinamide-GDP ribazoletransferase [Desulfovibrio sp.]
MTGAAACFLDALAFLTRIGPARVREASSLARAAPFFAPVGLALGLLCAAAAGLALALAPAPPRGGGLLPPALSALLWLGLEIWLTRGLHWDGLADLADAAGSPAPRFWEILKDSRMGVFGALALLLAFCGQWLALVWHLAAAQWAALIAAPAWARACALWLATSAPARDARSLGGMVKAGATFRTVGFSVAAILAALAAAGLPLSQLLVLSGGQYALTRALTGIAREKGGFSGDFLGAAIVIGQTWFLLALL